MNNIKEKMSTAYRVAQEMIKDKLKDVDEDMAAEFEELGHPLLSKEVRINNDLNFDQLPSVFGDDAENDFINFLNQLKINNFPRKKIKKFYYFKIGRWDLKLTNNKTIKFPYNVTNDIIKKSVELLNREDFQNYNIIDLRVAGKIIVE